VKFRFTNRFKKDYEKLPSDIQRRVDQKLRLLIQYPRYPSLRVHKLRGVQGLWEFSVTMSYRVIFEVEGEYLILLGVGTHGIVDLI
jgi:mRNA interferase RelE/StbE